jgi:hypothetical protein
VALQNDNSGCGNSVQDSLGMLKMVLGTSSGMMATGPTPTVAFVTPKDGSTVPTTFDIIVAASEMGGTIAHVDVMAGTQSLFSATAPPYKKTGIQAPMDGQYMLTATAYDAAGNFQSTTVTFTAQTGAPPQVETCMSDTDCNSPLVCTGGSCVMPGMTTTTACSSTNPCPSGQSCQPDGTCSAGTMSNPGGPTSMGGVGAMCSDSSQCASGLCVPFSSSQQLCTDSCDPQNASSCPPSMKCEAAGGTDHVCVPRNGANGGSGCSYAAHASAAPVAPLLLLLSILGLLGVAQRGRQRRGDRRGPRHRQL